MEDTMTDTKVKPETQLSGGTGDRDSLSHIVKGRAQVRAAIAAGTPVEALCGKRWVPRRWKPGGTLRCVVCEEIAQGRYGVSPQ